MPLYIAIPGFFVCTCLGYALACMCFMSGEASRREEKALQTLKEEK